MIPIFKRGAILLFALAVSIFSGVYAAGTTAHVSWTAPTTYVDGSALPAADIANYTLSWVGSTSGSQVVNSTSTIVNIPCGSATFTVTVTTTATAKYPNATSGPSSAVPYATGISCVPNPPGGVSAT